MKLLIVESPAKAKTISKYLDGKYTVKASVGHIRDLPKSNKKAINIEAGFVPHYEISPGKETVVAEIQALAAKADEILLATDPDREGEAIAWHIAQATNLKKPRRVVFHEITKDAIIEAMQHPRDIDDNLRYAQEARRVLDRLVGYDLSGLIWKKVRYGLSAGRVQSPALRIIMEREREIRAFISHKFWVITADTSGPLSLTCSEEPTDFAIVEKILATAKKEKWQVIDVVESEAKRSPKAPFITSTLQQTASTRLGFAPSRTMSVAQRLYEAGHITYMRTDSTNLSKIALEQIKTVITKKYGAQYHEPRVYAAKSKNAQEAHEGIRPTDLTNENAGMNDEQKRLYRLIWQRTIASQMADAKILRTKITANVVSATTSQPLSKEMAIPDFSANGARTIFKGWLTADPEAAGEEVELAKVVAGQELKLIDARSEEKATQPPSRYTEAGLIKELEKRGIGRPSTYASIIRTIEERGYVTKENKTLTPTDTGDVVSSFLEQNFMEYINDSFTAEMEDKLDDIAVGKETYKHMLTEFYLPFTKVIKSREKDAKLTNLGDAESKWKCPKCSASMIVKLGRNGKFLSCSTYPECDGALMMDGTEIKKDEPIGQDPVTGKNIYVLVGKYGPYVMLGEQPPRASKVKKVAKDAKDALDPNAPVVKKPRRKKGDPVPPKPPKPEKPRMASIPKGADLANVSVADAMKYLSLPKVLGNHPVTGKPITASIGRFGPYVVHDGDFRSVKIPDDIYAIELLRALEILAQEKKKRGFAKKAPKTE